MYTLSFLYTSLSSLYDSYKYKLLIYHNLEILKGVMHDK